MTITFTQSSPKSTTTNIYPSSSGCSNEWTPSVAVDNWNAVSGDSYYVSMATDTITTDSYSLPTTSDIGTIQYVNIVTEVKSIDYTLSPTGYLYARMSDSGCSNYITYDIDVTESYKKKVTLVNPSNRGVNPITATDWAWSDINSLQIGLVASSVTTDVVAAEILMANSDVTTALSPELYEGDWDCPMGMRCNYKALYDYPLDTDTYMHRTSSIGWVSSEQLSDSSVQLSGSGFSYKADLVVSDNDIIHTVTNATIEAFSSASGSLSGALRTYDYGDPAFMGTHISIVSSGCTDYLLVIESSTHKFTGLSMDTSTSSSYYVKEDEYITSGTLIHSDSCSDGTYHYVAGNDYSTGKLTLYSIDFDGSSISINDTIELDAIKAVGAAWNIGISCTDTGHITVVEMQCDSGTNATRYVCLYSLTVDGSGNFTLKDTDAQSITGTSGVYPRHATIDVGSEIITIVGCMDGYHIYQINDTTGVITHKTLQSYKDSDSQLYKACMSYAFEYGGKYYFGTGYTGMRIYEIDTSDYSIEVVGRRGRCSSSPFNEDLHLSSIGHIEEDGNLYLFTHEDYIHGYRLFNYYDTFGFETPSTLGTINNVQVKFVQNNYCGDECIYKVHLFSGSSKVTDEIYCNENTDKLLTFTFETDPNTGSAWTESSVTNITAGIEIIPAVNVECDCAGEHHISQLYLQVNHTLTDVSPEIRVKKQYIEVGYIPTEATVELNTPTDIHVNNSRNINKINFWNGSREVYDMNRNNKSMTISGMEWEDGGDKIQALRNMGLDGSDVDVTGFSFDPWNRTYKIVSLNWVQVSIKPNVWKWKIDLEEVNIEEACGED